ncbi:MAG: hypothetical protein ACQEQC_04715 [Elusimicrobiota bacterium]
MRKGKIITYTTLNTPPKGFDGPLNLCVVETGEGLILAHAENRELLKISRRVKIEKVGDLFLARKLKLLDYFK